LISSLSKSLFKTNDGLLSKTVRKRKTLSISLRTILATLVYLFGKLIKKVISKRLQLYSPKSIREAEISLNY